MVTAGWRGTRGARRNGRCEADAGGIAWAGGLAYPTAGVRSLGAGGLAARRGARYARRRRDPVRQARLADRRQAGRDLSPSIQRGSGVGRTGLGGLAHGVLLRT